MIDNSLDCRVRDSFLRLCAKAATPLAYKASLLVKRGEWAALVNLKVAIHLYRCVQTLSLDLQVVAYLKKYPGFNLGIDLEKKAVESFWDSERQCFRSNERISPLLMDLDHYGSRMGRVLRLWREEVKRVLGRAPSYSELKGKFGPGTTFRNTGNDVTVAHKLSDFYTLTQPARGVLASWDSTAWSVHAATGLYPPQTYNWFTQQYALEVGGDVYYPYDIGNPYSPRCEEYVRGNRFTTVPKDATKLRGICIEPSINVFYQLGVGTWMSERMSKVYGWDKETAQDFHKSLARIGSLTGAVATIDLSSASDTVCSNLVKLLLPPEWYRLVDDLRSHFTLIEGRWVKLEKFSSMGNGFTFELETLVFRTLAATMARVEPPAEDPYTPGVTISVFGDDIIVPTSISKALIAALRFFGFATNETKTFVNGRFRESCGGDFYAGFDVRPHYVKEVPNEPHQLIALANGIRRFGRRHHLLGGADDLYRRAWFSVLDAIPKHIRECRGPESLGDLVVQDDEFAWIRANPMKVRNSIRYLKVWRPVPNRPMSWSYFRPGVVMACALYGVPSGISPLDSRSVDFESRFKKSGVVPRVTRNGVASYVSGYKFGRVAYS